VFDVILVLDTTKMYGALWVIQVPSALRFGVVIINAKSTKTGHFKLPNEHFEPTGDVKYRSLAKHAPI
jgi:hypothetical protein